jgi:hypothetical protein
MPDQVDLRICVAHTFGLPLMSGQAVAVGTTQRKTPAAIAALQRHHRWLTNP